MRLSMFGLLFIWFSALHNSLLAQKKDIKLGAYYFDGWTGKTNHLSNNLKNNFLERKPILGWLTSTQENVEKQIDLASEAGLYFFSFCWYYNGRSQNQIDNDPKNNSLDLFLKAKNKKKMKFSLMIANHSGYIIKKEHWSQLEDYWLNLMKDKSYVVSSSGKPLISFFSITSLIQTFGSNEEINEALESFRNKAIKQGFQGLDIVLFDSGKEEFMRIAEEIGADFISDYNNHNWGLTGGVDKEVNINVMKDKEQELWSLKKNKSYLKQIPTITLNWDTRPVPNKESAKRFIGYSQESIFNAIVSCRKWMKSNRKYIHPDRYAFVYAWNEYAEGAWLTPSQSLGNSLLIGVKEGLKYKIKGNK